MLIQNTRGAALAIAVACSLSACATPLVTSETEQGLSCNYRRYPCDPWDFDSEWICSDACGYTAHCRDYTFLEEEMCATHPNQVVSLAPYQWCNKWGNPTWETWCMPTLLSGPSSGSSSAETR